MECAATVSVSSPLERCPRAPGGATQPLPPVDCCGRRPRLPSLREDADYTEPLVEPDRANAARAGPLRRGRAHRARRQSAAALGVGVSESTLAGHAPAPKDLGPVGFEPTTKGFTWPRCFHREWTISSPAHCLSNAGGCGML